MCSVCSRTPFVANKAFVGAREEVSTLVQKMVECVNDPSNPDFFNIPQVLVEVSCRHGLLLIPDLDGKEDQGQVPGDYAFK